MDLQRELLRKEEAYRALLSRSHLRAGIGGRMDPLPTYFSEVVVSLCPDQEVDLDLMEGLIGLLRNLQGRGYWLRCEEGAVCAEREVPLDQLEGEGREVVALAEGLDHSPQSSSNGSQGSTITGVDGMPPR